MGTHADHHQPVFLALACRAGDIGRLRIRCEVGVTCVLILEITKSGCLGILDFLGGAVTNENRLTTPFDS